jgi:hypothetical protein
VRATWIAHQKLDENIFWRYIAVGDGATAVLQPSSHCELGIRASSGDTERDIWTRRVRETRNVRNIFNVSLAEGDKLWYRPESRARRDVKTDGRKTSNGWRSRDSREALPSQIRHGLLCVIPSDGHNTSLYLFSRSITYVSEQPAKKRKDRVLTLPRYVTWSHDLT